MPVMAQDTPGSKRRGGAISATDAKRTILSCISPCFCPDIRPIVGENMVNMRGK